MKSRKTVLLLLLSAVLLLTSCDILLLPYFDFSYDTTAEETEKPETTKSVYIPDEGSSFRVCFIDVGQADCALIQCDGKSMLVDAGNADDAQLVYTVLTKYGVTKLDIIVGTHAHEDHMGAMATAVTKFDTGAFYTTKTTAESTYYQKLKRALASKNIKPVTPQPLDKVSLGSAEITFLAPIIEGDDINDTSVIFRIVYGNTSFLFTGDASRNVETMLLNLDTTLKSDVLKVGHHGSYTSTSYAFLRNVMPTYAVISCGRNNDYGHPHEEVTSRLDDADVITLRTDIGDIIFTSDGNTVTLLEND